MKTFNKVASFVLTVIFTHTLRAQQVITDAWTFIDKTQKEIVEYNKINKNELFKKENDSELISLVYEDTVNSMTHHFYFARRSPVDEWTCFNYLANLSDKAKYEKVKADILAKCQEILTKKSAFQVNSSGKFLWRYYSSDVASLYTVSCEKKDGDGNSR